MANSRARIIRFSNANITGDKACLGFDIETEGNDPASVEIPLDDVGMLASFLTVAAARGCEMYDIESKELDDAEAPIEGIPLRGIGFAQSDDHKEFQLILRAPGFWMAYQVDTEQMAEVADKMASIARLLATAGKPQ